MLNVIAGLHGTGAAAGGGTSYESIATVTVGSPQAAIEFTSIPSTYKHLQIRGIMKNVTTGAADYDALRIQYNTDTGTNYAWHYVKGEGVGSGGAGAGSTVAFMDGGSIMRSGTGQTSAFSASVIDVLDYANTSKYKTQRWLNGTEFNALYPWYALGSGVWQSTSAVTSIKIYINTGVNFAQYSQFALYGIKG